MSLASRITKAVVDRVVPNPVFIDTNQKLHFITFIPDDAVSDINFSENAKRGFYTNANTKPENGPVIVRLQLSYDRTLSTEALIDYMANELILMKEKTLSKLPKRILLFTYADGHPYYTSVSSFKFFNFTISLCAGENDKKGLRYAPHSYLMYNPKSVDNPGIDDEFKKASREKYGNDPEYFNEFNWVSCRWKMIKIAVMFIRLHRQSCERLYAPGNEGALAAKEDFETVLEDHPPKEKRLKIEN